MTCSLRTRIATITAAFGLAAAALLGIAGPASAAPAATVQIKPNAKQGTTLAVVTFIFQGQPASVIEVVPTASAPNAQWNLVPSGDGFSVQIVNQSLHTCLDTVNGANPSLAFVDTCNGSSKQRWIIETSVGDKRIKNVAFGTVLAPNDSPLFNNVFTVAPRFDTVGKIKQSWVVG